MTTRLVLTASIAILLPGCLTNGPSCSTETYARVIDLVDDCADDDGCDLADGVVVPGFDKPSDRRANLSHLELGANRTITLALDPERLVLYPTLIVAVGGLSEDASADVHMAFDGVPAVCPHIAEGSWVEYNCKPPRDSGQLSFVYAAEVDSEPVTMALQVYLEEEVETGSWKLCHE